MYRRQTQRFARSFYRHISKFNWKTSVSVLALACAFSMPALAQETAGQLNGLITNAAGAAAAGVTVEITHVPSGTSATVTTNAQGRFIGRGLRLGGPYIIKLTPQGGSAETVTDDVFLELGTPYELDYPLGGRPVIEEVVVSGTRVVSDSNGASTTIDRSHIEMAPVTGVTHDLKDIIRIDPKVKIDKFNTDAIQISGTNNRFNLLTIDGIRQNDDFGLNNSGYPGPRAPLSLDAIDQLSVNTAPFAVTYSGFQGGNINIVTKSGTNDWHGSAYIYYSDDTLIGNQTGNRAVTGLSFQDKTWGGTLGGPIIKDKLFIFGGYEKFTTLAPVTRGPTNGGFSNPIAQITQADYDLIKSIAKSVYNYDILDLQKGLPENDEKYFLKADWNINDNHRAVVSYNHDKGSFVVQNGPILQAGISSSQTLGSGSNWYSNIQGVDAVTVQVFSDWNDSFRTELKYGYKYQDAAPTPLGERPFTEMQIITPGGGEVSIGPDLSRHFNALTNKLNTFKVKGDYLLDTHTITAGYEREMLDVFNAFLQNAYGTFTFTSIANFQAKTAQALVFQNAVSGNINDAGATFDSTTDSLYAQDAWHITPDLTVTGGIRYEMYGSSTKPLRNANFATRYGYDNTSTYDGRSLFLPRLAFSWKFDKDTVFRGGVGLFGGGNPNVWLSNSFSNTGVATSIVTINRSTTTNPALLAVLNNPDGRNIPAIVQQQLVAGNGDVNAIDPNFKIPSTWKFDLGADHTFDFGDFLGDNYIVTADVIYGQVKDGVYWYNARLVKTGVTPDGRPIYATRTGFNAGNDIIMTNNHKGDSFTASLQVAKGWKTFIGDLDLQVGYAYNRARDASGATSSTALSNYDSFAVSDINNPPLATSNYELRHNGTIAFSWSKALIAENAKTTVSIFGNVRSGQPYSFTFSGASPVFGDPRQASRQHQLFYVPKDQNDVVLTGGLTWDALNTYIMRYGLDKYRGQIAPRNAFTSSPVGVVDLHFQQDIPMPVMEKSKVAFTVDISNLTNMLNNNWGRISQFGFPYVVPVVQATGVSGGKYIYSGPLLPATRSVLARQSVWGLNFGLRYSF